MESSATAEQPHEQNDDCHFFKLPPELRILIYDEVLTSVDFVQHQGIEPRFTRPALLSTCQLVQAEIAPLYLNRLIVMGVENIGGATNTIKQIAEALNASKKDHLGSLRLSKVCANVMLAILRYILKCSNLAREECEEMMRWTGKNVKVNVKVLKLAQETKSEYRRGIMELMPLFY